ncbi:D-tyrosyl-tRNA(Tyr) deacylase [Candidatus Falkowbacteria bacterium RIFOXYD2_FULL_35_9]|uniref:D-aminoacyl-tRNA deacylase n=1 Tax=Candidatus Falkowbacteria bacterium RIFOXYC2_FULL_36_12 TaxID=1798002 RepID=A0A1F5SWP8_9BACT|nr:MAG: D-tyrosyl-tRNA(Tyr) deacylase [Candidatus Falkowbacteria bacterium RIFOXYC2_FULL_36_12]OGF33007.1 MAG: D-tyrosyl-tRNA(Tyr) deacylase [Candidatus Falkowbacteria bacterium RIFOXYA2_FULL_35_8]OGF47348.1 MAG: D-tyrosyl-tRNA(Tyr) deacylase [Candidatus Falkowbacteria bacterium RIFOXYD2_FULL_35_9]
MKVVLQRVNEAVVKVEEKIVGKINKGVLILLGIDKGDTDDKIDYLVDKIKNLRIFAGEGSEFDKSLIDINGEVMIVSQFTLSGNCSKGRRPDFFQAEEAQKANEMYEKFVKKFEQTGLHVATGKFQSYMQIELINDGPTTFILEK